MGLISRVSSRTYRQETTNSSTESSKDLQLPLQLKKMFRLISKRMLSLSTKRRGGAPQIVGTLSDQGNVNAKFHMWRTWIVSAIIPFSIFLTSYMYQVMTADTSFSKRIM